MQKRTSYGGEGGVSRGGCRSKDSRRRTGSTCKEQNKFWKQSNAAVQGQLLCSERGATLADEMARGCSGYPARPVHIQPSKPIVVHFCVYGSVCHLVDI